MPDPLTSWEEAELPVLTEAEFAAWQRELGRRVVQHRGRYWLEQRAGFFEPLHLLARVGPCDAARPAPWCWGFRARLDEADTALGNAAIPVHLLPDLAGYDIQRLASKRRTAVRRCLREVEVVALRSPQRLLDEGYGLAQEAHAGNSGIPLPEPAAFRRLIESFCRPRRGLVLAGLRDGRLLGFRLGYAVAGSAYAYMVWTASEGRRFDVTAGLLHAFATLAQRSGQVGELMNGLHARENEGLCTFKRNHGFEVTRLPARTWLAPGIGPLLRRTRPHKYYRLTGRD